VTKRTTEEPTANDFLFNSFNTVTQTFQRNVADVVKAWPVILISGVGVAALVGLFYIVSLWLFVRFVVWGSVFGVQIMSIMFTIYLYIKAGIIQVAYVTQATKQIGTQLNSFTDQVSTSTGISLLNATVPNTTLDVVSLTNGSGLPLQFQASANYQSEFTSAAYFMTAITVMLFFLILLLGRRISRAIEIFQEASHAIRATPCLILLPFFSVPMLLGLIAWWASSTAFIASSGSYTIQQVNFTAPVSPDDGAFQIERLGTFSYVQVFIAFNFLGFLWISNFITAIVVYTIAGTVGHWYWKGNESGQTGYGAHPLLRSIYITFRFHLGTAAFGALMVAIVQFIRYVAAYLEQRSKSVTKRSRLMRAVLCCVNCMLKCLECCVKFISRNAFIISALYGESFCTSTRQAFYTITSNLAQVALVTFLGDLILRFGQILITLMATFACWVYLDNRPEYDFGGNLELNTFWFPTFLAGALGWFVANECLSIYDITVDTLLISFCQDQKLKRHMEKKHKTLKSSQSMHNFIKKAKHMGDDTIPQVTPDE
jgi:choline transporter-like protein 2/4/5